MFVIITLGEYIAPDNRFKVSGTNHDQSDIDKTK